MADMIRKCAGTDVSLASDDDLLAATILWESVIASAYATSVHLLGELERRGVCDRAAGLSTASWVARETRTSRPSIAGRVNLASKLRTLPVADDALSDGSISVDHARVIADAANPRIAETIESLQSELVSAAGSAPFPVWRRHVTELAELLDQDGGYDPSTDLNRDWIKIHELGPLSIAFNGELHGHRALSFRELLHHETDRQWRRARNDHYQTPDLPIPSRSTLSASALVELIAKGSAGQAPDGNGPVVDVTLIIRSDNPDTAVTLDGTPVDRDVTRHLRDGAQVTPVHVDNRGVPLDLGRTVRYASRVQRRALAVRDGGCVFPGCDLPMGWTDAHHVTPWGHGGLTDLHNLASLCRHHHGVTHRRGWTMTADPDQTFTWITPSGRTLHSQRNRGSPDR